MNIPCFATWQKVVHKLVDIAETDGLPPVCIAVCDPVGHLILFVRMDGAVLRSIVVAQSKAYTSARMGTTTAVFWERLRNEQLELSFFCDQQLTAFPGGTPIYQGTELIGAIGISGRKPMDDQKLADCGAELIRDYLRG